MLPLLLITPWRLSPHQLQAQDDFSERFILDDCAMCSSRIFERKSFADDGVQITVAQAVVYRGVDLVEGGLRGVV